MGKGLLSSSGPYAIAYTDVYCSTLASELAGDQAARRALQSHDQVVRAELARHQGVELTHLGDGFKLAFPEAAQAIAFAVAVQRTLEARRTASEGVAVRIGIHVGDALLEEGDLFGRNVILAQRITARAQPTQILVSEAAAGEAGAGVPLVDRGLFLLKGIREGLRLYEVAWREDGATAPVPPDLPIPLARDARHRPPLLGRQAEFESLERWLEEAERGASRFVVVTGEAGIGKTRLCMEFLDHIARRTLARAVGRAYADGGEPYGPVLECVGQLAGGRPPPRALLPALAPIARTAPLVARALGLPRPTRSRAPADQDPAAFRAALASTLVAWSRERPLVLLLDDLQWLDSASFELVRAIGRRMVSSPVGESARLLVLATLRAPAPDDPAAGLLRELERDRVLERISLAGLPEAGLRLLVRELLGDRATSQVSDRILARSQGNPFFVEELCRDLAERAGAAGSADAPDALTLGAASVPAQIKAVLEERFARLSPSCLDALRVAALLEPQFRFDVWRDALGLPEEAVGASVEEAIAARLLRPVSGDRPLRYAFEHVLVAEALRDAPRTPRRQRQHVAIADALERLEPDAPGELARQLLAAGEMAPDERVARWCHAAGASAALHAPREAARLLSEALAARDRARLGDTPESDAIRLSLFEALGRLGEVARAADVARPAIDHLEARGDAEAADRARARLARIFTQHALPKDALRTLEPALNRSSPSPVNGAALAEYAVALDLAGDAAGMKDTARALLRIARRENNPELHERGLAVLRNWSANHSRDLARALALSRELLAAAQARRDPGPIAANACDVALFELVLGRVGQAVTTLDLALREATRADAIASLLNVRAIRALAACYRGEWEGVSEEWAQAAPLLGRVPGALRVGLLLWARTRRELWLGRPGPPAPAAGDLYGGIAQFQSDVLAGTGLLAAEAGAPSAAAILRRAQERQPLSGVGVNWLTAAQAIASGWVVLGDREAAEPWYAALTPYRGTLLIGPTDLILAGIARLTGRLEEAERHLARALRLARREGLRPWLVLVRAEQARVWAARGAPVKRITAALAESRMMGQSLGMPHPEVDVPSTGGTP